MTISYSPLKTQFLVNRGSINVEPNISLPCHSLWFYWLLAFCLLPYFITCLILTSNLGTIVSPTVTVNPTGAFWLEGLANPSLGNRSQSRVCCLGRRAVCFFSPLMEHWLSHSCLAALVFRFIHYWKLINNWVLYSHLEAISCCSGIFITSVKGLKSSLVLLTVWLIIRCLTDNIGLLAPPYWPFFYISTQSFWQSRCLH